MAPVRGVPNHAGRQKPAQISFLTLWHDLESDIKDTTQYLGIFAGVSAGAMAERHMDYGVQHQAADRYAEYGGPLTEEEISVMPTMSDVTASAAAADHILL